MADNDNLCMLSTFLYSLAMSNGKKRLMTKFNVTRCNNQLIERLKSN